MTNRFVGNIAKREKLITAGLFLAKYDKVGLTKLGFGSFTEAFNVIGYALGGQPASVKNYRDEFDPIFPNSRQGWHKRPLRDHCRKVFDKLVDIDLDGFADLVKSFVGYDENTWSHLQPKEDNESDPSSFAKRLITGLAAEKYFEFIQPKLPEFCGCSVENTTRLGCGYDYRLRVGGTSDFLAVEVKGLQAQKGSLLLTPKEYETAGLLSDRFFLFVVKNFRESPFHEIYKNPLSRGPKFSRNEKTIVQVSWLASV